MKRHLSATVSVLLWTLFVNAQDKDTITTQQKLGEVVIYKANTVTPVTYQNLDMHGHTCPIV